MTGETCPNWRTWPSRLAALFAGSGGHSVSQVYQACFTNVGDCMGPKYHTSSIDYVHRFWRLIPWIFHFCPYRCTILKKMQQSGISIKRDNLPEWLHERSTVSIMPWCRLALSLRSVLAPSKVSSYALSFLSDEIFLSNLTSNVKPVNLTNSWCGDRTRECRPPQYGVIRFESWCLTYIHSDA